MLWEPSRLCRRTWCTSKMTYPKSPASRRSNTYTDTWHMLYTQNFIRNSFRMHSETSTHHNHDHHHQYHHHHHHILPKTRHILYTQNFIRNSKFINAFQGGYGWSNAKNEVRNEFSTPNNPILDTLHDLFLEKKIFFLFWPKNAKKMPQQECKIFFFQFFKIIML